MLRRSFLYNYDALNMSKPIEKHSIEIEPLYQRASCIIENARTAAYRQINEALVRRNWLIGQLIVEKERKGNERADYGVALIKMLSKRLTEAYGKGFTKLIFIVLRNSMSFSLRFSTQ